jgi:transcriptional regulator with XRE-family HTH domain
MTFAENLRQSRLDRFLSQSALARLAGMHAVTITRLESGRVPPSMRSVRALADALSVEPRTLAEPNEVAELRRLARIDKAEIKDRDRLGSWADDGGSAPAESGPSRE